jgi:signal transduction histidine kinase
LVLLAAVLSGALGLVLKVPFLNDKLTYDQRQSAELNVLLLSSLLWMIYMWKDLHDFPQAYTTTFVLLTFSIFNLFKSLKQCLYLLFPILIIFVLLSTLVQFPTAVTTSVVAVLFTALFLLNRTFTDQPQQLISDNKELNPADKLEMVGEIDEIKTENKNLKEQLKQIEINLSAAEMAKMEFLATMSHEIRTPLNGIIPLLDILLDSDLSDFQRDYLSTAHISSIQMQKLIDDLLDY